MNERIRKLLNEATSGLEPDISPQRTVTLNEMEKFAELIVQECIDIIAPYTVRMSRPGEEYLHPILEIKQHFGVESTSIKVGSRVKVVSGFNVGAKGTVSYIEPTGRMWVMRDGASTDVFYTPDEVVRIEQ